MNAKIEVNRGTLIKLLALRRGESVPRTGYKITDRPKSRNWFLIWYRRKADVREMRKLEEAREQVDNILNG